MLRAAAPGAGPGVGRSARPRGRMELEMLRNYPLAVSEYNATIKCRECEIFIGTGHNDAVPIPALEGGGFLCRACLQAELRRRRGGWRAVDWEA